MVERSMLQRLRWLLGPLLMFAWRCSSFGSDIPESMRDSAVGKKPTRLAKSEPYVACEVCKLATRELWSQVEKAVAAAPYGKLGELAITQLIDTACEPDDEGGEWLNFYDVVQSDGALQVAKQEDFGECRRECTTLAHACKKVFDEHREDMAEMLYKRFKPFDEETRGGKAAAAAASAGALTAEKFSGRVCKKLSRTCPGKAVPSGFRHKDEPFLPIIDEEGLRMRRMQHAMNKQAKESGSQPVQFLDPMGAGMLHHGDDDEL
eukprot:TRINITY_DN57199_c0_g1_i1.p1 TRINITY_DN57199_c0_g1~~TRINITY_DN57199_c0_g1_i1.p1  ORF type:complete len:300 (+),score=60.83 TRINITY_DN57199_c0_g1_i1:112-900(+)